MWRYYTDEYGTLCYMRVQIQHLIQSAIEQLQADAILTLPPSQIVPQLMATQDSKHGHYASNIALVLSKFSGMRPMELAQKIIAVLPLSPEVSRVELAAPGFINFFLTAESLYGVVGEILAQGDAYGKNQSGMGRRVHIEFVSANPTGPLHVGHGRSAAYGACVANLLEAGGFTVYREYYVNDAGRQIGILAFSVWMRYLNDCRQEDPLTFPPHAYQGEYIIDVAKRLREQYDARFYYKITDQDIEQLAQDSANPDLILDRGVAALQKWIGKDNFMCLQEYAWRAILKDIKEDLEAFGVRYDHWFLESSLLADGLINEGMELLKAHGYVYEKDGAQWFRALSLGDEKDRVLIRRDGKLTYFASDVAYHLYKYNAGYHEIIDIFGADHHGYIGRIRAFLQGLGKDTEKLRVLLVQFATLFRDGEKLSMSTRGGHFVTLRELRDEVGNDAARFFYIMRKKEQHLDFDIDIATSQSQDNPVYYIQYAHARACSVWRNLEHRGWTWSKAEGLGCLSRLSTTEEQALLTSLCHYSDVIDKAMRDHAPHLLAHYLQALSTYFHAYYNKARVLVEDTSHRHARLCLMAAVQQVIANGLTILGISAPSHM